MSQIFRTIPVGLGSKPALYQLSIRAPGQTFSEFSTYTFPITPSQLRADYSSLSTFTDTQGPSSSQGVTRVVDIYGLAPPVFTLEGTTGYDMHMSDGFILSGTAAMALLAKFLSQYATLNQVQRQSGNSQFYTLEFYDYFQQQFWQVEPVGPQMYRQANDRPNLIYYRFRWAAYAPAGVPILGEIDAFANLLATPAEQAAINAAQTVGALLTSYGPSGPVGSALGSL
jgi:hypothetical protein